MTFPYREGGCLLIPDSPRLVYVGQIFWFVCVGVFLTSLIMPAPRSVQLSLAQRCVHVRASVCFMITDQCLDSHTVCLQATDVQSSPSQMCPISKIHSTQLT